MGIIRSSWQSTESGVKVTGRHAETYKDDIKDKLAHRTAHDLLPVVDDNASTAQADQQGLQNLAGYGIVFCNKNIHSL